ncbi:MAG: 2-oxoacid:acceptor oxidoreductase family protein, partial [candidate division WOR-3 bacterium]
KGAVLKNYNASVIPSYGSQVKGGCVEVQIIISKEFIPAPFVSQLNILCALSQIGYDNNLNLIKNETTIFYDETLVKEIKDIGKHIPVPATQYCLENFNTTLPANLFFIGFLTGYLKDYLNISDLEEILKEDKKLFTEINLKALKEGYLYFKEKEV